MRAPAAHTNEALRGKTEEVHPPAELHKRMAQMKRKIHTRINQFHLQFNFSVSPSVVIMVMVIMVIYVC